MYCWTVYDDANKSLLTFEFMVYVKRQLALRLLKKIQLLTNGNNSVACAGTVIANLYKFLRKGVASENKGSAVAVIAHSQPVILIRQQLRVPKQVYVEST
jgi:hypothetical protein